MSVKHHIHHIRRNDRYVMIDVSMTAIQELVRPKKNIHINSSRICSARNKLTQAIGYNAHITKMTRFATNIRSLHQIAVSEF